MPPLRKYISLAILLLYCVVNIVCVKAPVPNTFHTPQYLITYEDMQGRTVFIYADADGVQTTVGGIARLTHYYALDYFSAHLVPQDDELQISAGRWIMTANKKAFILDAKK